MQCFLNRGSGTDVSPVMFLPKPGVSLAAARNTGEDARGQNKITGKTRRVTLGACHNTLSLRWSASIADPRVGSCFLV